MTAKPPQGSRGQNLALCQAGHMSGHLCPSSPSAGSQVSVRRRMSSSDLAQSYKFPSVSQLYPQTVHETVTPTVYHWLRRTWLKGHKSNFSTYMTITTKMRNVHSVIFEKDLFNVALLPSITQRKQRSQYTENKK